MASQIMKFENAYSNKTLIGNWSEERELYQHKPMTASAPRTKFTLDQDHTLLDGYRKLQSAGMVSRSTQLLASKNNLDNKGWSSLSLKNKGAHPENQFTSTNRKNYLNPYLPIKHLHNAQIQSFGYNQRSWKMIKGHWEPEPLDTKCIGNQTDSGLHDKKQTEWRKDEKSKIFGHDGSDYQSNFGFNKSKNIFPKRFIRTTLSKSTQLNPIIKDNGPNLILRGSRVTNIVPDIVNWSK